MGKLIWRKDAYFYVTTEPDGIAVDQIGLACEVANIACGRIFSKEKIDVIKFILLLSDYFGHFGVASLIKQSEKNDQALKSLISEANVLISLWIEEENIQTMHLNKPLEL